MIKIRVYVLAALIALLVTALLPVVPAATQDEAWTLVITEFDGVEMVLVPAGCFVMGITDEQIMHLVESLGAEQSAFRDEQPAHTICFEHNFWIDRHEVTNGQFDELNGQAAEPSFWDGYFRPRGHVTWLEASDFCANRGARLPTEAEWEYAARGPENWIYPWGNEFVPSNAVHGESTGCCTTDVASKPGGVSWVGAEDMAGNVWEWVADWYAPDYYEMRPLEVLNPQGPTTGTYRVLRGGSFFVDSSLVRVTKRNWHDPNVRYSGYGFRCAYSEVD